MRELLDRLGKENERLREESERKDRAIEELKAD